MKKVLSLFLSLSIMMMSISFTAIAGAVSVPEITSYGFMTVDGKVITTLGGETSIKAYVDIENKNHITNSNLGNLVATCTVDGMLVSTTTLPISIESNTYLRRMETNDINVPIGSENVVFKVFIMDSLQNIRPVVNMYKWGSNPNAVNDGTKYADAIKIVTELAIMNGYEDGSFRADGDVTRAEFAAVMIRLLGKEWLAQNAMGSTLFSDVSAMNWASGYINIVAQLDFMSGYEDGRFGPDNNITLEQGIKGFVTALGYAPTVGVLGYPLGYIDKANTLGITNGIPLLGKEMISRGVLAKLIANSLEVPICENNVVQNGITTNTIRKTILSEYKNLVKLQVIVNEYMGFTSNSNNVNVTILNNYRTIYYDEFRYGSNYILDAGTSNISELVGRKAIVYVTYDENTTSTPVIFGTPIRFSDVIDTNNGYDITISAEDIESVTNIYGTTTVEYWANETDVKTTKITYDTTDVMFYENGCSSDYPPNLMNVYGSITFAKLGTESADFDTVLITNYTNFVVDTVSASTFRVTSKNGVYSISFDPDDVTVKSTLYDTNGKQMNWADLKENDVISCKIVDGNKRVTIGQLVNNKVTGMVTEIDNEKYTIDGKQYKLDPAMMQLFLADQGTFYLDVLGNICYFEKYVPVPNYAYVIAAACDNNSLDPKTQLKLFNAKGEIAVFNTSLKVKLDGISNIPTVDLIMGTNPVQEGQFITYTVNSNNEITTIDRANTSMQGIVDTGIFSLYSATLSSVYASPSKSLTTSHGKVYLSDKTIIMVAPFGSTNDSDYKLINTNIIQDAQLYEDVEFLDVNADREVGAVLVHITPVVLPPVEPPVVEPLTEIFATITGMSTALNIDGDIITKIKTLQGGVATTLTGSVDLGEVPPIGATIIPVQNVKGEVMSIYTLAVPDQYFNFVSFNINNSTVDVNYIFGKVRNKRMSILTLECGTTENYIAVPKDANVYIYDERASSINRVTIGDISNFNAELNYNGMTTYDQDVVSIYTIAREYNDKIIDVVIYIFKY